MNSTRLYRDACSEDFEPGSRLSKVYKQLTQSQREALDCGEIVRVSTVVPTSKLGEFIDEGWRAGKRSVTNDPFEAREVWVSLVRIDRVERFGPAAYLYLRRDGSLSFDYMNDKVAFFETEDEACDALGDRGFIGYAERRTLCGKPGFGFAFDVDL